MLPFGMVMFVILVHPLKAQLAMAFTPSGIVMLSSEEQSSKALYLMLVTLFGIVTLVKSLQPLKAYSGIYVSPSLILTDLRDDGM